MQKLKIRSVKCKRSHKIGEKFMDRKIRKNLKKRQIWELTIHIHLLICLKQWVKRRLEKVLWTKFKDLRLLERQILYLQQNIQWFKNGEAKQMERQRLSVMDMNRCQKAWAEACTIDSIKFRIFLNSYFCLLKELIDNDWLSIKYESHK